MPLSQEHIKRVLNVKGYAFVDPDEAPHLIQRYTESFIRRKLFAMEDEAVMEEYQMYEDAFQKLVQIANDLAWQNGISTLANDGDGLAFRREFIGLMEERLDLLASDIAFHAFEHVTRGYLMAWYGRLWMLDSMTTDDVINIPRIGGEEASTAVMQNQLLEDVGNKLIYDLLGQEWRELYANELDLLMLNIRRTLTTGMGKGSTIPELMNAVAKQMGVEIDRRKTGVPDVRANFNRVQTITRSYFINANNSASLGIYQANPNVVNKVMFITANDGRVCPICLGHRGKSWDLMSLEIIHPVTDTHPNCRCSLIPIVYDSVSIFPPDQPPEVAYDDWLLNAGAGFLVGYFAGSTLKSTRV